MGSIVIMDDNFIISNLNTKDCAFTEADEDFSRVHIRVQQRNARKRITLIEGLDEEFNFKKILKYMKRGFKCNGACVKSKIAGTVIQLQGTKGSELETSCSNIK